MYRHWMRTTTPWLVALWVLGCTSQASESFESQRLVDVVDASWIEDSGARAADGDAATPAAGFDWEPVSGIRDLEVTGGGIRGLSTSASPMLRAVRGEGVGDSEPFEEVRIRMRADAGTRVSMHFISSFVSPIDAMVVAGREDALWLLSTELIADGELHDYVLEDPFVVRSADIRQVWLRPTNAADAEFEVESVRLVFRRDKLAELASGVRWQRLGQTSRESVLVRTPQSIRWPLTLPERPRLELALATLDERPVTFTVDVEAEGQPPATLVRQTVDAPELWQDVALDLDRWAGRRVVLHLATAAGSAGVLGLWGAPAVRARIDPEAPETVAAKAPQAVIFILADTLRADHLAAYGYPRETAPQISRLAAEGALFRDAVSQGTWTKVSAASLFTSLYPSTSGVLDFSDRVPSSATTLAEVYKQAGWATVGWSSVPLTGKFSNLHQGYEVMHEFEAMNDSKTARGFVDELLPWLDDHRDQRFFVFLHVFDPHSPYEPDDPYRSQWADPAWHEQHRQEKRMLSEQITDTFRKITQMPTLDEVSAAGMDPQKFIGREMAWYDGSIRAMDSQLERVFERLRQLGLDDRTLVVFTSDHGEEFYDHGDMLHGHSAYGELTNVPLLFWYPRGVPSGLEVPQTVQLLDVMPTLLELSGLAPPAECQGQSLTPLLTAAATAVGKDAPRGWRPRPAIVQRPHYDGRDQLQAVESTAILLDGWKLIHHSRPRPGIPEVELFDHRNDPLDQHDLAGERPDVVARLSASLTAWRQQAEEARIRDDGVAGSLEPDELARLRALGYVQ
jgi:arylsulfatase A-like enzyme